MSQAKPRYYDSVCVSLCKTKDVTIDFRMMMQQPSKASLLKVFGSKPRKRTGRYFLTMTSAPVAMWPLQDLVLES